jgi:hypothetical protein
MWSNSWMIKSCMLAVRVAALFVILEDVNQVDYTLSHVGQDDTCKPDFSLNVTSWSSFQLPLMTTFPIPSPSWGVLMAHCWNSRGCGIQADALCATFMWAWSSRTICTRVSTMWIKAHAGVLLCRSLAPTPIWRYKTERCQLWQGLSWNIELVWFRQLRTGVCYIFCRLFS